MQWMSWVPVSFAVMTGPGTNQAGMASAGKHQFPMTATAWATPQCNHHIPWCTTGDGIPAAFSVAFDDGVDRSLYLTTVGGILITITEPVQHT
jgi:hypothetical protein